MTVTEDVRALCAQAHDLIQEQASEIKRLERALIEQGRRILKLELALSCALPIVSRHAVAGNDEANLCDLIRFALPEIKSEPARVKPRLVISNQERES